MPDMKSSCEFRTICEVLRDINDIVQEDTPKDAKIRKLVAEAFEMGKKMAHKLLEYNQEINKDWWAKKSRTK